MYPLQDPRSLPVRKQYGEHNVVLPTQDRGTADKGRQKGRRFVQLHPSIHPDRQTEDPNSCSIKELLLIFGGAWFEPPKESTVHNPQSTSNKVSRFSSVT
jgi:hypothetical protein